MRVARWKVMAGGLLLSAGGLMAVADGPPVVPLPGCQPALLPPCLPLPVIPTPATPAVTLVRLEQPIAVPAPSVVELPIPVLALPPISGKALEPMPALPIGHKLAFGYKLDNGTTVYNTVPPPTATNVLVEPKTGHTTIRQGFVNAFGKTDGERQSLPLPAAAPNPADTRVTVCPDPTPTDLTTPLRAALPPVPVVEPKPVAAEPAVLPVPSSPLRAEPFVNTINSTPAEPAMPAPAVPVAAPEPRKPDATPSVAEKRLKVVLHMGDDRPRFEVRDGDEIYLKVVSDRVEVKSATDKADAATMKAGGKVGFVTPGGDGTCDELTILPGSGQVVAVGNVAFRHTWGRSETTVTAERMTFRLAHPGPTAIQAGYTPVR